MRIADNYKAIIMEIQDPMQFLLCFAAKKDTIYP